VNTERPNLILLFNIASFRSIAAAASDQIESNRIKTKSKTKTKQLFGTEQKL
jgi:hypothetical protein